MRDIQVAFFDAKPYDINSFDAVNKDFEFKLKYFPSHLNPDTALLTKGYQAACIFVNDLVTPEIVDSLLENKVELLALRSAGYNNVNLKSVHKKLHVVRVPAYSPHAVAEHAVALMMALNRKTHKAYNRIRDNNFTIQGLLGFDMHGKTAGVIGTGNIGKVLINILVGFGMKVLAYDLYPDQELARSSGCTDTDLDTIYRESDIISLHCPLTEKTLHMINRHSMARMKDTVMIINTGRGKLIDTKDLIEALKNNKVGAAGLDVYEEESEYFFEDFSGSGVSDDVLARLMTFPNVLITSHQGFFTKEALANIARTTLMNIRDFFSDKPLVNEICYKCNEKVCNKEKNGRCF